MDWVQVTSSLGAIIFLAYLASKMFPNQKPFTKDDILKEYQRYNPGIIVTNILLSQTNDTALLQLESKAKSLGIVTQRGDKLVCRTILFSHAVNWQFSGDRLLLTHDDFTQPSVAFKFSASEMQQAKESINSFERDVLPEGKVHAV